MGFRLYDCEISTAFQHFNLLCTCQLSGDWAAAVASLVAVLVVTVGVDDMVWDTLDNASYDLGFVFSFDPMSKIE